MTRSSHRAHRARLALQPLEERATPASFDDLLTGPIGGGGGSAPVPTTPAPTANAILSGNLLIAWDFSEANVALDVTVEAGQMRVFETVGGARTEVPIVGGPVTPAMLSLVVVSTGAGNDRITISPAVTLPASVNSGSGSDTLIGGSGNDILNSGPDGIGDVIAGGAGDDNILGGAGDDTLSGGGGNDLITGAGGDDVLVEAGDLDFILTDASLEAQAAAGGPAGTDSLSGIERACLTAGGGANRLDAAAFAGPVTLDGGAGADTLIGGAAGDLITGGLGNDLLTGGPGDDTLDGGDGTDRLVEAGDVNFTLAQGTPRRDGRMTGLGADVLVGSRLEEADLTGGDGDNQIDARAFLGRTWLRGGAGNDTLRGGRSADILLGGDGNDHLDGGAGRDLLIGGAGADRLTGRAGSDLLVGGATTLDGTPAALDAIWAEWTRRAGYAVRVAHLLGTLAGGRNGAALLTPTTAPDDGAADLLIGGAGLDWFVAGPGDVLRRAGMERTLTL